MQSRIHIFQALGYNMVLCIWSYLSKQLEFVEVSGVISSQGDSTIEPRICLFCSFTSIASPCKFWIHCDYYSNGIMILYINLWG